MSLLLYHKKRDFKETPEPAFSKKEVWQSRFVVQKHHATNLHYDFRLELQGVLKSWAVPKGPSMDPDDKRLAVMVEDHPLDYIYFEGVIPKGNYGAGTVKVWDKGNFMPVSAEKEPLSERKAIEQIRNGELKFILNGSKLKGEFVLVRLKGQEKNWLMIKHRDEYAKDGKKTEKQAQTTRPKTKGAPKGVATKKKS